jgi:iron complex outermembrane receptor protein
MHFKADTLPGNTTLNDGQLAYQFKATNTFVITKTFKAEISTDYQSPLTYGLLKIKAQYSTDAGLSKSFANKKANLKFSVSDIFNTDKNRISSNYTNQTLQLTQKNESRIARLTFTYNFGNSKIKTRQHSTSSNEKDRVKGSN